MKFQSKIPLRHRAVFNNMYGHLRNLCRNYLSRIVNYSYIYGFEKMNKIYGLNKNIK